MAKRVFIYMADGTKDCLDPVEHIMINNGYNDYYYLLNDVDKIEWEDFEETEEKNER